MIIRIILILGFMSSFVLGVTDEWEPRAKVSVAIRYDGDAVEVSRDVLPWSVVDEYGGEQVLSWGSVEFYYNSGNIAFEVIDGVDTVVVMWNFEGTTGPVAIGGGWFELVEPAHLQNRERLEKIGDVDLWVPCIVGILFFVVLRDSVWRRSVSF